MAVRWRIYGSRFTRVDEVEDGRAGDDVIAARAGAMIMGCMRTGNPEEVAYFMATAKSRAGARDLSGPGARPSGDGAARSCFPAGGLFEDMWSWMAVAKRV